jgi:hypothetical protein
MYDLLDFRLQLQKYLEFHNQPEFQLQQTQILDKYILHFDQLRLTTEIENLLQHRYLQQLPPAPEHFDLLEDQLQLIHSLVYFVLIERLY